MEKKKQQNSFFKKLEINSIVEIFEIYLIYEFDQKLIDSIAYECGNFLLKRNIEPELINSQFRFFLKFEKNGVLLLLGANLLSSLWIINIFPENPKDLIDKSTYTDSDFVYKFYTKNKNLSIIKNKKNERESRSDKRNQ